MDLRFDPCKEYQDTDYTTILEAVCLDLNVRLVANTHVNSFLSGSTGVLVLVHDGRAICANVGDSRAGLVRMSGSEGESLEMLSRDHTPAEADERERILQAGGKIMSCLDPFGNPIGPPRIWDQSGEGPGLMMSRSFGDQMGHLCGMTAMPEVKFSGKFDGTSVLVVGSDGLWEKMSDQLVTHATKRLIKEKDAAEKICKELVSIATLRWNKVG